MLVICPVLVEGNRPSVAGGGRERVIFLFVHLHPGNTTRSLIGVGVPSPVGGEVTRGVNVLPLFPLDFGGDDCGPNRNPLFPKGTGNLKWDFRGGGRGPTGLLPRLGPSEFEGL